MTLVSEYSLGWSAEEAELRGVWSKRRRRRKLVALLIALDTLSIFVSFFAAAVLYDVVEKWQWLVMSCAILPVYLGLAGRCRSYSGRIFGKQRLGVSRCYTSFIQSVGIVTLMAFLLKIGESYSRVNFAVGSLFTLALFWLVRFAMLGYLRRAFGDNPYCSVLVHDGTLPRSLAGFSIIEHADNWLTVKGDLPTHYERLGGLLKNADRVVVACSAEQRERIVAILKSYNVLSEVLLPEVMDMSPLSVARTNGFPTLVIARGPLDIFDSFTKRAFDLIVSMGALVLFSPLMILTAIAVKLDSPGPVLFMQNRIGLDARPFRMLKFRSMRMDCADASASRLTARGDDRVTRVGRIIRRTSIDELPQLFNVLIGTMSIVGPRPHAVGAKADSKLYWEVDPRYWLRHCVKPGLTGLAQVRGFRGNTFVERDLSDRLQADLEYIHGWSLLRDMAILIRTVQVLTSDRAF